MNVKNNKRRQRSREKIEAVFIELLQTKALSRITVAELCEKTGLNRSTFYANYADIYALADALRERLEQEVADLYADDGYMASKYQSNDWVRLFAHMRDNPLFYKTYFALGYDNTHAVNVSDLHAAYPVFSEKDVAYHVTFFKAGFNALVKQWLHGGCVETPEEMNDILRSEYAGRLL